MSWRGAGFRVRSLTHHLNVSQRLSGDAWVTGRDQAEAQARAEAKFPGEKFVLEQDEDVLDTWFSSGLWPFSIQGWPSEVICA